MQTRVTCVCASCCLVISPSTHPALLVAPRVVERGAVLVARQQQRPRLEKRGDDLGMGEDGGDDEGRAHVRPPRLVRVRVGVRVRAAEYLTLFLKP